MTEHLPMSVTKGGAAIRLSNVDRQAKHEAYRASQYS
jgi:hypothetical protein